MFVCVCVCVCACVCVCVCVCVQVGGWVGGCVQGRSPSLSSISPTRDLSMCMHALCIVYIHICIHTNELLSRGVTMCVLCVCVCVYTHTHTHTTHRYKHTLFLDLFTYSSDAKRIHTHTNTHKHIHIHTHTNYFLIYSLIHSFICLAGEENSDAA